MTIRAWQGDITTLDVDAIVNAASNTLFRGGGVCGVIHRAAGPQLEEACDAIGWVDTGDAVATPGFDLPTRHVIHAVGPVYESGEDGEAAQLASCYRRSLEVGVAIGARSIALPAISTGIFGFPHDEAAQIAVSTVQDFVGEHPQAYDDIILVAYDDETFARYAALLG